MRVWQRNVLTGGLIGLWLAGLAWAFWWFEGRYVKAFDRPAFFQGVAVTPPFPTGAVQVVHVWRSGCPCNAGHQDYVNEMSERFAAQGVRFARAGLADDPGLGGVLKDLPYWPIPEEWASWPGAPAVAIWDATGHLAYVGPYSDGAHCNSDSSLIEPVLVALLQGRSVAITQQDTVSCLCDL
ncbi:thiol-disulfide isomerase [Pseudomonas sp. WN033]|nr:thiol-disulfide isomerase [Pseudomonas sp. WN033]